MQDPIYDIASFYRTYPPNEVVNSISIMSELVRTSSPRPSLRAALANTLRVATKSLLGKLFQCVEMSVRSPRSLTLIGVIVLTGYLIKRFNILNYFVPRALLSKYIERSRISPVYVPETLRNSFNSTPLVGFKAVADHTHPTAAADRSGASSFVDHLAALTGMHAYFYQMSRADERNQRMGSREFFWTKDFNARSNVFDPPDRALIALIDVDQYVDMPSFLSTNVHPTIIYTFQPERAARTQSKGVEYSYTFNANDEVVYNVNCGALYTHQVWNWSSDHLKIVTRFMGVPTQVTAYLVDRRRTSPDHELIMLTPQGHWTLPSSIPVSLYIDGRPLQRLRVHRAGFTRLMINHEDGVKISTAVTGGYACGTVNASVDNTISIIASESAYPITLAQVQGFTEGDKEQAAPIFAYHRSKNAEKPDVICPVPMAVRSYQFDPSSYDPAAKPNMVAFMTPFINDAFVPANTLGNERQAVKGRVVGVRPKELTPEPFLLKVMLEFVERFVERPGQLDPVDYDEVMDRQDRPTQRRILSIAGFDFPRRVISSFVKKEPYANVKDPRVISTINGVDKMNYSMFTYAMEGLFKIQPWYAFGQTPAAISGRVCSVLEHADMCVNTDFSRFDGHGSNVMRDLERMILVRAFRPTHHQKLLELHRSQYNLKAYASLGTRYNTAFSRASGSPETSLFNSLVNAFVAYLALRKTRINGIYITADQAYAKLGLYGGDDGLTADVVPSVYSAAAAMIGQELSVEPIYKGKLGVKFLARIYGPEVWYGDPNSCCDLPRQLSKLHVTVALPSNVTPKMKLVQKCINLVLSDENTPIVGAFASKVLRLQDEEAKAEFDERLDAIRTWTSYYSKEVQYPNHATEWMTSYSHAALPSFNFKRYESWLESTKTIDDLLKPPTMQPQTPAKSSVPVVVDDEIVPHGCKVDSKVDVSVIDPTSPSADPSAGRASTKAPKHRDAAAKSNDAPIETKQREVKVKAPLPRDAYTQIIPRGTASPSPELYRPKTTATAPKPNVSLDQFTPLAQAAKETKLPNKAPATETGWKVVTRGRRQSPADKIRDSSKGHKPPGPSKSVAKPAAMTKAEAPSATQWRPKSTTRT